MWLPVPLVLADAAVRFLPDSVMEEIRNPIPSPYREVITKELLQELVRECRNVFKEYKGLEIVHVEAQMVRLYQYVYNLYRYVYK